MFDKLPQVRVIYWLYLSTITSLLADSRKYKFPIIWLIIYLSNKYPASLV